MKSMKKETKKEILSWARIIVFALAIAFIIRSKVIILANVPSCSMENTIMTDDNIIGNRLAYEFGDPQRGEVAIFYAPDEPDTLYVKRVIGMPGDKVVIDNAKIYINGSELPLEEDYLKEEWTNGTGYYEYQVPKDCYLMLGDNRNDSKDARMWTNKYVKRDAIVAKAEFVCFPFDHIGSIEN